MKTKHRGNAAPVTEQAAEWFVELSESPLSEEPRRGFFNWLKKSPQHIEEFLAISALSEEVSQQSSELAELISELQAAAGIEAGTAALFADDPGDRQRPARSARRRRLRAAAWSVAAACAAGLAALVFLYTAAQSPDPRAEAVSHRTGLGEQRSIALSDGSIVTLNTLSEAIVRFEGSTRRVTLLAGEAMFDVVTDQRRPFVVEAGGISLKVLGTRFSVYRRRDATRVAVVEGTVGANAAGDPDGEVLLHGGEGAIFTSDGEIRRGEAMDIERAVAWTGRRLMFDNARLADVAYEFNRYNRLQLSVEDPALADRRITTVVNAHDVSALIGFLRLQPDVEIEYDSDTIRITTESR